MLTISLILLLLFSMPSVTSLAVVRGESGDINYSIKSTVTFVNPPLGTRTWNLTEEDRAISLFMNNSWQIVELKGATYPFEVLKSDTDGNNIAVLKFPKQQLPPGENLTYIAEYHVVSKPRTIPNIAEEKSGTLKDIPQGLKDNYTRAEGPWLVNDSTLVGLAHEIAGNETKVLTIIKSFVGWIKENIHYTTHEVPYYANETLIAHQGDCDDQAILLVTLARIMGIPSHLQIGSIYTPERRLVEETYWEDHVRAVQREIGWHGWAMMYIPPWRWLPVDLTYVTGGFDNDSLNAIRYGAVASQKTIQYMNFSKVDHVAESRQTKIFIIQNGFFVDLEDEMDEIAQDSLPEGFNLTVAVTLGMVAVILLATFLLIAHRWRRNLGKPEAHGPPNS